MLSAVAEVRGKSLREIRESMDKGEFDYRNVTNLVKKYSKNNRRLLDTIGRLGYSTDEFIGEFITYLHDRLGRYRHKQMAFGTFVYYSFSFFLKLKIRKAKCYQNVLTRQKPYMRREAVTHDFTVEDSARWRQEAVKKAIAKLPEHWRAVVEMRMDGMKFYEIGEKMNIVKDTARQRYEKALSELRHILTVEYNADEFVG